MTKLDFEVAKRDCDVIYVARDAFITNGKPKSEITAVAKTLNGVFNALRRDPCDFVLVERCNPDNTQYHKEWVEVDEIYGPTIIEEVLLYE